jgi:hypothetical protein
MMKLTQLFLATFLALLLAACETAPPPSLHGRSAAETARAGFAEPPRDRPGLGTKWGETRQSQVEAASFERADSRHPFAVASIYYNDATGVRAMAGAVAWRRHAPFLPDPAAALITVELRDESGRLLPGLVIGDRWFVIGEEGRRYSILLRNRTDWRLEVVLSVDGLDVIDGRPASFRKRGYVVPPQAQLAVEGFRQSTEAVAAFRFGPVRESYANEKYHNTRNVGVIGVALFNEAGTNPWTWDEVRKRLRANPFPGQFATPP